MSPPPRQTLESRSPGLAWVGLLLCMGVLAACAGRKGSLEGESVQRVTFEGNGGNLKGTSDYNLRTAMYQEYNPPFTWLLRPRQRRVYLNRQELMTDGWRIETWYAHRGYFDARFLGWHVEQVHPAVSFGPWKVPSKVRIRGQVEEGAPSVVRSIEWEGMDLQGSALRNLMARRIPLQVGERFDLDYVEESREIVLVELHERSYAFAEVEIEIEAFPEEEAVDIRVVGDLGSTCTFGDVTIQGSYRAPERRVQDAVTIESGQPYRGSAMSETQKSLFALGIFSVVNIVPDLENAEDGLIPVTVSLSETKARELRMGGGMAWESGKEEIRVSADLSHSNLFRRLIRVDLTNDLGYASVSELDDVDLGDAENLGELASEGIDVLGKTAGPVVDLTATVVLPDVPMRFVDLEQTLGYEMGVEPGYRYSSREFSPGIRLDVDSLLLEMKGRETEQVSAVFRYSLEYFDYLEFSLDKSAVLDTPLGLDFTDLYLLSSLTQELEVDSRNDVLFTREGSYGIYTLTEAGGPLKGRFNFVRATFDQRAFIPLIRLRTRLDRQLKKLGIDTTRSEKARWFGDTWLRPSSIAGRMGGGFILPYGEGERAAVPYAERLNLGGSTNIRGWTLDHIGPYAYDPDTGISGQGEPGEMQLSEDIIPLGGLIALHGSAELRIYGNSGYGLVFFTDLGNVWSAWSEVPRSTLLPSIGLGLRYVTPIGPLRVDVARRMDQEPMYALENRWALHISFSEAY